MNIKISVIIPIFNMSKWIGKAIDTVEKQKLKELEIICVDDGSTDNTLEILNTYKQKYSNLIIIHQDNQGAGPARNLGMDYATGEYLFFLDADDYFFSEDALEYLYKKAKEKNAYICRGSSCDDRDGIICYDGLRSERSFQKEGFIKKEAFPGVTGYWAGIYCRSFIVSNKILFPDLRRTQDGVFFVEALAKAGEIYCVPKQIYVYRKEHKKVLYSEKKAVDAIKGICETIRIASENGLRTIISNYRKEISGEPCALLYKYAATGNSEMLMLATELNRLINGDLYEGKAIKIYIEEIQKKETVFLNELKNREEIYVFGAGTIGGKVVDYLKRNGIIPTAVIVSDMLQNPQFLNEIPVRQINEIRTDKDYEVIIATFPYSQDAIARLLKENNFTNIIPLDLCAFFLWQDEIIH